MYESLTSLLSKLQGAEYGEWIIDRENDGSPEHPKQFPFVAYGRAVTDLENAIYRSLMSIRKWNSPAMEISLRKQISSGTRNP